MNPLTIAIVGCWVIFFLFWRVAAFSTKPVAVRSDIGFRVLYGIPMYLAFLAITLGYGDWALAPLAMKILPHTGAVMWLGLALTLLGLALAISARISLGKNWSHLAVIKEGHELVMEGPYSYIRHPIYSALILMFVGSAVAAGTVGGAIGIVLITVSCWIKLVREEELMRTQFPDTYPAYMGEAKRLIPFVF